MATPIPPAVLDPVLLQEPDRGLDPHVDYYMEHALVVSPKKTHRSAKNTLLSSFCHTHDISVTEPNLCR